MANDQVMTEAAEQKNSFRFTDHCSPITFFRYCGVGRGCGAGRGLGVGVTLGVAVGVGPAPQMSQCRAVRLPPHQTWTALVEQWWRSEAWVACVNRQAAL